MSDPASRPPKPAAPPEAADTQPAPKARRGIQWDEGNLEANAEWHREHPVTMKIDEPKTPFSYDDGEYPEDSDEEADRDGTWADAAYNHLAAKSRHEAPVAASKTHRPEGDDATAEGGRKPRPKLSLPGPDSAAPAADDGASEDKAVFKHMRKAVYADEGKKFLAMRNALAQQQDDEEEDEDDANGASNQPS
uniref:Protein phosphatase inhibitor 2 n=1 Tax=Neobodo designis TaxID=312471 RepID=A0A6U4X006_NEODS|mmetsp:Transcript_51768/g.159525  ORF Transcript_51768/g.159525 Transcript_51768/m.159525 type:complete len:192 (+) Transcript_51768:137-712(+)|eukprot:CAMPEP_0174854774 /NCGR_PEP_ID=MMETSP1114-20130205/31944_1 /TAXON_ID=312471 /ORGANISM="Neobodo designis, Strain CCAP 1951/1" /LENGTH=191 /DNA_ID=CAMNT_0016089483 /DNA_START=135 /DNA_END=710 /DNA_ORIENTATION=-